MYMCWMEYWNFSPDLWLELRGNFIYAWQGIHSFMTLLARKGSYMIYTLIELLLIIIEISTSHFNTSGSCEAKTTGCEIMYSSFCLILYQGCWWRDCCRIIITHATCFPGLRLVAVQSEFETRQNRCGSEDKFADQSWAVHSILEPRQAFLLSIIWFG